MDIVLNNREIAFLIITGCLLIAFLSMKTVRGAVYVLLKCMFKPVFLMTILLAILYVAVAIYFLGALYLWDISMIKETFVWFTVAGISIIFRGLNKDDPQSTYAKIIRDFITISLVFGIVYGTYCFSIVGELVWQTIFGFIVLLLAVNNTQNKDELFHRVFTFIQNVMLLCLVGFLIYNLCTSPEKVFNLKTLKLSLLPIILGIWMIPFGYSLSIYSAYEQIFILFRNKEQPYDVKLYMKFLIFKTGLINGKKIIRIRKMLSTRIGLPLDHDEADNLIESLQKALKDPINDEYADLDWGDNIFGDSYSDTPLAEYLVREIVFFEKIYNIEVSLNELHEAYINNDLNFNKLSKGILKYEEVTTKVGDEICEVAPPYEARKLRRKLLIYVAAINSTIHYFTEHFGNKKNIVAVEYLIDSQLKTTNKERVKCNELFSCFIERAEIV